MARSESTKTHLENVVITPSTSHGDADGDVAFQINPIDSDVNASPTAAFKIDENGNTTSNSLTITRDDTTDGVVDVITLTHSSSDSNATAGDGIGVSFKLENATGTATVEEWASMDVLSTTVTNNAEDGDI
ncbi:MAG: hypothetical protein KA354_24955, partial [Phycisphaerae bacterium]|nr:hypothetical protein [Phycisphaerae bacterium]